MSLSDGRGSLAGPIAREAQPAKPRSIIAHVDGSGTDDPTVTDSDIADTPLLFISPRGTYITFQVYVPGTTGVKTPGAV